MKFACMYTLNAILEILRQHKPELQRKYPISKLGVFGSYARGGRLQKKATSILLWK